MVEDEGAEAADGKDGGGEAERAAEQPKRHLAISPCAHGPLPLAAMAPLPERGVEAKVPSGRQLSVNSSARELEGHPIV